ncbi:histidinol-phosphate aminotransferase [compost metagenome]
MVDVRKPAAEIFNALRRRGIIVRAGHKLYQTYIRVTVGSAEQNKAFIAALEQVLQEQGVQV